MSHRKSIEEKLESGRFYYGSPCSRCGNTLRYKSSGGCYTCHSGYQRIQYQKNPVNKRRVQENHLKRKYGITLDEYDQMLASQDGGCAICGGPPQFTTGRFHVDHDHATGAVRGLLCGKCNIVLGHVGDDVTILVQAITYLGRA